MCVCECVCYFHIHNSTPHFKIKNFILQNNPQMGQMCACVGGGVRVCARVCECVCVSRERESYYN